MNEVFEQLKTEALYAQRSFSTELLYQAHGAAQMARQLNAITHEEAMDLNNMTVRFMNTDREYIQHKNKEFADHVRSLAVRPKEAEAPAAQGDIPRGVLAATVKVLRSYRERLEMEAEVLAQMPDRTAPLETRLELIEIIRRLEAFYSGLTPPEGKGDGKCE